MRIMCSWGLTATRPPTWIGREQENIAHHVLHAPLLSRQSSLLPTANASGAPPDMAPDCTSLFEMTSRLRN